MGAVQHKGCRVGCKRVLWFLFFSIIGILCVGLAVVLGILRHYSKGLPDVQTLGSYEPSETSHVYGSQGELLATLYKENRRWTEIQDIPTDMVDAIVAIEDSRFYEHTGVDPIGVLRAAYYDLKHQGAHQGASTVTMQLARNLFLNPERSFERKIREVLIALQIEKRFSKDEIMELYLNQIYFGAGAYGLDSASRIYFNKKPSQLTLSECSLLGGLPQAPSTYDPFYDKEAALERQSLVLHRMLVTKKITRQEYEQALSESKGMEFVRKDETKELVLKLPYFTTYVLKDLSNRYDEDYLYRGGLKVYTTVDVKLQKRAELIAKQVLKNQGPRINADNCAAVIIENRTGFIRAMVGGLGWSEKNQFNRAWQARRQPGSSFKPLVYTQAMMDGYNPGTIVSDSKVTFYLEGGETWSPKNSDLQYMGPISVRTALQYSRNVVAVRLIDMVGVERVVSLAYQMGIKEKLPAHLSLALGSVEVSPLEMASAYSTIANLGVHVETSPVKSIINSEGSKIEDWTIPKQKNVFSEVVGTMMVSMMRNAVENGTGTTARIPGVEVAGKTGTTDSFRDAWFCGFTPQYTIAVWVGNDDNSKMNRSYGGDVPARLWRELMILALGDSPKQSYGTSQERDKLYFDYCTESKQLATSECPSSYPVLQKISTKGKYCPLHGKRTSLDDQADALEENQDSRAREIFVVDPSDPGNVTREEEIIPSGDNVLPDPPTQSDEGSMVTEDDFHEDSGSEI